MVISTHLSGGNELGLSHPTETPIFIDGYSGSKVCLINLPTLE